MSSGQHTLKDFRFDEKYLSQIPALQQLINLGFEYPPPEQILVERTCRKKPHALKQQKKSLMQKLLTGKWQVGSVE